MSVHQLVVTAPPCGDCTPAAQCQDCIDYPERDYTVTCPGVTDACRRYNECRPCTSKAAQDDELDDLLYDEPVHGMRHTKIAGMWCTPSEDCNVAAHEALNEAGPDVSTVPGTYPVDFDWGDGTELYLTPIKAKQS